MDDDTRRGSSAIYRTLRGDAAPPLRSVSLRTKHSIDRLLVVGLRPQASAPTTPNTRTLVSPTCFGERIPCGGEVGGILLCGDRGPPAPEQDPTRSGRLPIITDGRFRYISCSLCLLSENTKYKKLFSPSLSLYLRSSTPDESISTAAATSPLASYSARRASPAGNPISVSAARPSGSVAGDADETDSDNTASEATAAAVAAVNAAVTGTSIDSIGPASFITRVDDREAAPCGVRATRAAAAAAAGVE